MIHTYVFLNKFIVYMAHDKTIVKTTRGSVNMANIVSELNDVINVISDDEMSVPVCTT